MCGIAGILTNDGRDDLSALEVMRDALRHRGPDDTGIESLQLAGAWRLGLAHTRLAIQDLSAAGHQPMRDAASNSWIVLNGEIYNHQSIRRTIDAHWQGTSDTETLLKA